LKKEKKVKNGHKKRRKNVKIDLMNRTLNASLYVATHNESQI